MPQTSDPRSLLLSLQKSRNGDGDSTGAGSGKNTAAAATTENQKEATAPVQNNPIAFSITLPKTAALPKAAPGPETPSVTGAAATGPAAAEKDSLESKSSAGGKQNSDTSDSNDSAPKIVTPAADSTTNAPAFTAVDSSASGSAGLMTAMTPVQTASYSNSGNTTAPPATAQAASTPDLPPDPVSRTPQSIDLKMGGSDSSQVDVRVSQRAGDVQVTVRTPDNDLADSLRQHLPELSDRLAQNGVAGEMLATGTAQASADTAGNQESWSDQSQGQQQNPEGRPQQSQDNENGSSHWQNQSNHSEKEDS